MESTTAATPYAGPTIIDMWLSAAEGDASGLRYGSFIGDLFFSKLFVWGQAAVAGALVGAWLGFHATAGFLALATAIRGAVGGGNLLLTLPTCRSPFNQKPRRYARGGGYVVDRCQVGDIFPSPCSRQNSTIT